VGFGNPEAPIVFISPSPLDTASASNEAFNEWLDHEARLEHHMTADTPQPYFQFVRAVLLAARRRMGQKLDKRDVLDSAFHPSTNASIATCRACWHGSRRKPSSPWVDPLPATCGGRRCGPGTDGRR
jgi:hypothetical protein